MTLGGTGSVSDGCKTGLCRASMRGNTESPPFLLNTHYLVSSGIYEMKFEIFLSPSRLTEMTLSQRFSRFWWNPAAFKDQRAKGPQLGSADNFLRVSVCVSKRVRVTVQWPRKKFQMLRNLSLLGILCVCVNESRGHENSRKHKHHKHFYQLLLTHLNQFSWVTALSAVFWFLIHQHNQFSLCWFFSSRKKKYIFHIV